MNPTGSTMRNGWLSLTDRVAPSWRNTQGFPIWWYVAPTIVNTFLEAYDFSGKKIVLFATSGGSGFGNTVKELQPSAPDAVITEGSLLNRGTKKEISEWVKSL